MGLVKKEFTLFFAIGVLLNGLYAFQIVQHYVSPQGPVNVGSTVELSCTTDDHYEYCDWWVGDHTLDKECRFEWKRKHDGVRMQKCNNLKDRMQFDGNYNAHECKVILSNVRLTDEGLWTCKIEEYASLGRGPVRRKHIKLDVLSGKHAY